jgi:hypothetical protein
MLAREVMMMMMLTGGQVQPLHAVRTAEGWL